MVVGVIEEKEAGEGAVCLFWSRDFTEEKNPTIVLTISTDFCITGN